MFRAYNVKYRHHIMQTCMFLKMFITVKIKAGADPGFFLGGGAPVRNGVTDIFFLQNTTCIRKPEVISGWGVRTPCTLPLDPPLQG